MNLKKVKLVGFRNFKNATISLNNKSLLFGANDVGKTNFIYALRLLLDKSISEADFEPTSIDFYSHEDCNEFSITIFFEGVTHDAVRSQLGQYISDDDKLCIKYVVTRDNVESLSFESRLYLGVDENRLEDITERGRFYRRSLNLKYISSRRNLFDFIKKEKHSLIEEHKENRSDDQVKEDDKYTDEIKTHIKNANDTIGKLSYIKNSTTSINTELTDLSKHHEMQEIVFDTGLTDISHLMEKIELSSRANGRFMGVGGDGRNNQIFLALWSAKNKVNVQSQIEFTIFCIEEPESHLHPHQQRQISKYFVNKVSSQLILTTHSPQIASEFSPDSLIRLYFGIDEKDTKAGGEGVSLEVDDALINFGYRLNVLSAESFFSNIVILVEGTSEVLLLKALSDALEDKLDKLNISIVSVEGIGFMPYIQLYESMELKWMLKTDNDIFKIPNKNKWALSGLKRAFSILKSHNEEAYNEIIAKHSLNLELEFDTSDEAKKKSIEIRNKVKEDLEKHCIFLSINDLETDLVESNIKNKLVAHYSESDTEKLIKLMKTRKAENLFEFLSKHQAELKSIASDNASVNILYSAIDRFKRDKNEEDGEANSTTK